VGPTRLLDRAEAAADVPSDTGSVPSPPSEQDAPDRTVDRAGRMAGWSPGTSYVQRLFGVCATADADVPVQVASPCPYHVPTVEGGAPTATSRIAKHVPVADILAAAQSVAVGVVITLTRGFATVEAAVA
jgi:hypothetical protein